MVFLLLFLSGVAAIAEEEPPAVPLEQTLEKPGATGLAILTVGEGSQAAAAGLELGDILTHYDGTATPTLEALRAAMTQAAASGAAKTSVVLLVHAWDGTSKKPTVKPGMLGITAVPVEKGKASKALPPATAVHLDFSRLADAAWDDWYAFHLGPDGKKGFEHVLVKRAGHHLVVRHEVAFDGGEPWGVNHFDVSITMSTKPRLALLEVTFDNPITSFSGRGRVDVQEDGTRELQYQWENEATDASGAHGMTLPADLPEIPSYFVRTLVCFMPRDKGTCLHFRPVVDGWGTLEPRAALFCAGPETIEVDGKPVETVRYEQRGLGGGTSSTYSVDKAGRVVKAFYGGPTVRRTTKKAALADLHASIRPRTAN